MFLSHYFDRLICFFNYQPQKENWTFHISIFPRQEKKTHQRGTILAFSMCASLYGALWKRHFFSHIKENASVFPRRKVSRRDLLSSWVDPNLAIPVQSAHFTLCTCDTLNFVIIRAHAKEKRRVGSGTLGGNERMKNGENPRKTRLLSIHGRLVR